MIEKDDIDGGDDDDNDDDHSDNWLLSQGYCQGDQNNIYENINCKKPQ